MEQWKELYSFGLALIIIAIVIGAYVGEMELGRFLGYNYISYQGEKNTLNIEEFLNIDTNGESISKYSKEDLQLSLGAIRNQVAEIKFNNVSYLTIDEVPLSNINWYTLHYESDTSIVTIKEV